ncbi:MAG TPA: VanZ family protein, partial [Haliangiales bacterium]|nr:VanZ family protein [Haliangiales bacterium]
MEGLTRWGPAVLWAAVIFALSSIPGRSFPEIAGVAGVDKLAHMGVFAVFGFLVARAVGGGSARAFLVAAAVASAYGALDEFHQLFTPGRDASVWDFAADTLGGAVGAAAR